MKYSLILHLTRHLSCKHVQRLEILVTIFGNFHYFKKQQSFSSSAVAEILLTNTSVGLVKLSSRTQLRMFQNSVGRGLALSKADLPSSES